MFQIPGAAALWRSLSGGGAASPSTQPTLSGSFPANVGEVASYPTPQRPRMAVDEILQQVWPQPWYGSGDLDPIAGDSPENRAAYLALYKKEPRLNAAIEGKIASISTMKFRWKGADENSMADVDAAQFVDESIKYSRHGGTIGLIASIMRAGQVYGWSAGEIKLCVQERGRFRGKWGLEHVRNLNTEPFIKLQLDVFRNITGVVNLIRGIQDYDPKKFVFYVNKPIFSNPFGQSDVQPAQRAAMLFREVYQIWYIALKRYGLPYMHGKVGNPNYRKALEQAMEDLQGSGWAVTGPEDEITVLNLAAAAAANGFEAMIDKCSEDIFFAVRGASTPSQVSSNKGSDVRGSSEDSKNTGQDPIEKMAAEEVCKSINQQLVPALMGPNFPPSVGMPYLSIGDADEDDAKTRLDIIDIIENKLGRPCSTEEIYEIGNVNPADPSNPEDAKRMQSMQQQAMKPMLPGQGPPGSGGPPQPGGGGPPASPTPPPPQGGGTQMSQPVAPQNVTGPDALGVTQGMTGDPVPPELLVAMLQAQMEGHPAAADAIAEMGSDPEALREFMADRDAGTQGMMSSRMFSAFAKSRTFGWFSDPTPRSPSRVTNSDTGAHRYGEAARRALAWQGREDKGEAHPQTTKDLLIAKKAEAEPQREQARAAFAKAIADPGSVHSGNLKQLADHLHTLTRDEVKSHLASVQRKAAGKLKQDLVDALLSHVRDTAVEHHEAKLDPLSMDMEPHKAIADLQGTSLPKKSGRDQDAEAAHLAKNDHTKRKEERHELVKAGTQGELDAPGKVSHGTPDTGSILKEERAGPDKTKPDPPEAQERTEKDEYRDEVAAQAKQQPAKKSRKKSP